MVEKREIRPEFLSIVGNAFARGDGGLTGPAIGKVFSEYALRFDTRIPFPMGPGRGTTKLDAFLQNIEAFSPAQQYLIIYDLCDQPAVIRRDEQRAKEIRTQLIATYPNFSQLVNAPAANIELIEETKDWLAQYPESQSLYETALEKYGHSPFERNLLDDLRLCLESLLKTLLGNKKPLEKQVPVVGSFIKNQGGSKELANMFERLINYYANYQNTYVKHNDSVIEAEIDFILEITSSFMKHLVKLSTEQWLD